MRKKDSELIRDVEEATTAESAVWKSANDSFIDPGVGATYRSEWKAVYLKAKSATSGILARLGLSNRSVHGRATTFTELYESIDQRVAAHNDEVTRRRIEATRKLICPVEGRQLDDQQLACISKEPRSHLVLAGAGTGKTTTIVGYVKYLMKTEACKPEEILVLSFTRASASEMAARLKAETGITFDAYTFHKLGINIISAVEGNRPSISTLDIRTFARNALSQLTQDKLYLRKLCKFLAYGGGGRKTPFDFDDKESYEQYLKENPPTTLRGETVKSLGEMDVANFLFLNGIAYEYERPYERDTRDNHHGQYRPDFYLTDHRIYLEYYGIDRSGHVPSWFEGRDGKDASRTYLDSMAWKQKLHRENGTDLLELFAYQRREGQLFNVLAEELRKRNVPFHAKDAAEVWSRLSGRHGGISKVTDLFATAISLMKNRNVTPQEVAKHADDEMIHLFYDLVEPVYDAYQEELARAACIDFDDMIIKAADYVSTGAFEHPWKYVVIDEYQDISRSRWQLIGALRKQSDFRLFCVGDDWQGIYRFSGSDIGFILNFERYWGPSEISRIETTYRFPQSIVDVSSRFVMGNPAQMKKNIVSKSDDTAFAVGIIEGVSERDSLRHMQDVVLSLPSHATVMFLGRYTFDTKLLGQTDDLVRQGKGGTRSGRVVSRTRSDLKMEFRTVHGSKGLQADYVFLLNNRRWGMGFPSRVSEAPVLSLLLEEAEAFPDAEERRLFYVALTRAKHKVWLVVTANNKSSFVAEVEGAWSGQFARPAS